MSNSILYPAAGSRDRFTKSVMVDVRKEMTSKLSDLRIEQHRLTELLAKGFDNEVYRKLSLVNHSIEVADIRRKGIWIHGSFPDIPQIAKSK